VWARTRPRSAEPAAAAAVEDKGADSWLFEEEPPRAVHARSHARPHAAREQVQAQAQAQSHLVERPAVRSRLSLLVCAVTGAARVVAISRLPAHAQPAFDARRGGSRARSLAGLTSAVVDEMRAASFVPPLELAAARYMDNAAVLRRAPLSHLLNPVLPLAFTL